MQRVVVRVAIVVTVRILGEVQGQVDLVRSRSRRTGYLHDMAVQHNWRECAELIGAAVASIEVAEIRPRKEPLVGRYRITRLVSAKSDGDPIDRRAERLKCDSLKVRFCSVRLPLS